MYLLSPGGGMGASSYSFPAEGGYSMAEALAAGPAAAAVDEESLRVRGQEGVVQDACLEGKKPGPLSCTVSLLYACSQLALLPHTYTCTTSTNPPSHPHPCSPLLQAMVVDAVQTVLGSAIGSDQPLMAGGLDSLGATELQQSLADGLGLELPSTLVFDYPTVDAIVEFLAGKLAGPGAAGQVAATAELGRSLACMEGAPYSHGGVAILGAAGHTALLQQYRGGDASNRVPLGRWDADSALITGDGTMPAQVRLAEGVRMVAVPIHWVHTNCPCVPLCTQKTAMSPGMQ